MKNITKDEILFIPMVLFIAAGNFAEVNFKYSDMADSGRRMLILVGSTICCMLFMFFAALYVMQKIMRYTNFNKKALGLLVGIAAACLLPVQKLIYMDNKTVLPINTLWYEIKDVKAELVDLDVRNVWVEQIVYTSRGGRRTETYLEYVYNGKVYRVSASNKVFSKLKIVGTDTYNKVDNTSITVYPNTGIAVDIVYPIIDEKVNVTSDGNAEAESVNAEN